jgi:MFS family permease
MILRRFKRRRAVMLFNQIFYYFCIIFATTIMPKFVEDNNQKTLLFGVFIFAGNLSNSLLGSGATAWHMRFLPEGRDRGIFFSYSNLVSALISTAAAVLSAVFADSLANSPKQAEIIVMLRFFSYFLSLISGLLLYLIPKEFDYPKSSAGVRPFDIFVTAFRTKKFMLTTLILIFWNSISGLNINTWNYYMLNTVKIGYTYIFTGTFVSAVCSIFLLRMWRNLIDRYSWFKMLFVTVFVAGFLELPIGFSTNSTKWVYIMVSIAQGFNSVGLNLVFANLFYINLLKSSTDNLTVFWNFSANISVLIGSVLGTWFLSLTEPIGPWSLFGLPIYGSQFLVWIKFISIMGLCLYIKLITPHIQPDTE